MSYYNNSFNHETNIIQQPQPASTVVVNTRRSFNTYEHALSFIDDLEDQYKEKFEEIRKQRQLDYSTAKTNYEKRRDKEKEEEDKNRALKESIREDIENLKAKGKTWFGNYWESDAIYQKEKELNDLRLQGHSNPWSYMRYERSPVLSDYTFTPPWAEVKNEITRARNVLSLVETERVKVTRDEAEFIASINYGTWQENLMDVVNRTFGEQA